VTDQNTPVLILGFATTIVTLFYNAWTAERRRKWQVEDQDRKSEITAKSLAELTIKTAANLAQRQNESAKLRAQTHTGDIDCAAGKVITKIEEVGAAAGKAYEEASNVNQQIHDLQQANLNRNKS
jgi:hypothetical protein